MKTAVLLLSVLSAGMLGLAQTGPEPQARAPAMPEQPRLIDLPLDRKSEPLVLFELAAKDEKGRCRVHHDPLTVAVVPIAYGLLPGIGKEYYAAEGRHFPNALARYEGGCLVMGAKEAKVLHCPKCLATKKAWEAKHRR